VKDPSALTSGATGPSRRLSSSKDVPRREHRMPAKKKATKKKATRKPAAKKKTTKRR
jgi:hypothetical protein